MIARRLAMRDTPMASVIVTAAGSPSGMAPTASATAALNIANGSSPRIRPTPKVIAARPKMAYNSTRLSAAILSANGVERSSADPTSSEMRPISVWSPVAVTIPVPCPDTTRVDE